MASSDLQNDNGGDSQILNERVLLFHHFFDASRIMDFYIGRVGTRVQLCDGVFRSSERQRWRQPNPQRARLALPSFLRRFPYNGFLYRTSRNSGSTLRWRLQIFRTTTVETAKSSTSASCSSIISSTLPV